MTTGQALATPVDWFDLITIARAGPLRVVGIVVALFVTSVRAAE